MVIFRGSAEVRKELEKGDNILTAGSPDSPYRFKVSII